MICKICGKELPDGSTVCKYCGARCTPQEGEPGSRQPRRYSKKGIARRRLINTLSIVAVLLIIVLIFVLIIVSAGKAAKTAGQPEQTETTADTLAETTAETQTATTAETQAETAAATETQTEPEAQTEAETQPETETTPAAQTEPAKTGTYTLSINRTEVTASLRHYRELNVSVNETLPADITILSTVWSSNDESICRAEDGEAWGVAVGKATVTATVTLSDGQVLTADCLVTVVESQVVSTADYILPESAARLYTASELESLTAEQLTLARNEIYARHGRKFNSQTLQQYFDSKSWYSGTVSPESFSLSVLSSIELSNIATIQKAEASR
ncbi:MAG: YARHG domain-containing protein [Oscillospiraceae bacterium]|nr:YARHG domain-containing protein [Oscillospiraceae bacterium]